MKSAPKEKELACVEFNFKKEMNSHDCYDYDLDFVVVGSQELFFTKSDEL